MGRLKIPVGVTLFIAIWLLALCVPPVREISGVLQMAAQVGANQYEVKEDVADAFAREFPAEPIAAGWSAENAFYRGHKDAVQTALARFPDDLQLRGLRLQTASNDIRRTNGTLDAKDARQRAEFVQCAQIAREGGQRDPNNAFWPWMEAAFEFSTGQNDAALQAFERLQTCTRFEDYAHQRLQARLSFWKRHGNPSFEQKLGQLFFATLFPHLTALRESGELAATRAAQLRKERKTARAIAIENGVLNAMRLLRHDSSSILYVSTGENGARDALGKFFSIAKPIETMDYVDPKIHGGKLARAWAAYARENRRPQLAHNADFVGDPSAHWQWGEYVGSLRFAQFGFDEPWGTLATAGPLLLFVLGLAIFVGAIVWALAMLLREGEPAPARGQVVACANFSFWLLLGICVIVVFKLGLSLNPFISFEGGEMIATWTVINFFILALLCWLLPVWFVNLKRGRKWQRNRPEHPCALPLFWNRARKVAWALGVLGLATVFSNGRGLWDGTPFQFPVALGLAGIGLTLALSLELARWNMAGTRIRWSASGQAKAQTKFLRWAPWLLWGITFVGVGALISGISQGVIVFDQIVRAILTLLALSGALVVGWKAARDHFGWQLARRTLGVLVLMWSIAFLFFALGLVPVRAQLNRNLDRQIQIGEIAWMREQAAKTK